jgi:hypothetical protein
MRRRLISCELISSLEFKTALKHIFGLCKSKGYQIVDRILGHDLDHPQQPGTEHRHNGSAGVRAHLLFVKRVVFDFVVLDDAHDGEGAFEPLSLAVVFFCGLSAHPLVAVRVQPVQSLTVVPVVFVPQLFLCFQVVVRPAVLR